MAKLVKFLEGQPLVWATDTLYDALQEGTMGSPTESSFVLSAPNGARIVFQGNFTISGGVVTGGTATGFDLYLGSTKVMKASGATASYADLVAAIAEAATFELGAFNDLFVSGAKVVGSNEDDFLSGAVGGKLLGRDGDDYIATGLGLTTAKGGDGNDVLVGNGESRLLGGKGEDIFTAWGPDGGDFLKGGDFFKDFSVKDDVVALHPSFYEGPPEGHLADSYFNVGKAAETADHHVIYDKKTGILYWDADGSGVGAQEQVARLPDHLKLKADNIFFGDYV